MVAIAPVTSKIEAGFSRLTGKILTKDFIMKPETAAKLALWSTMTKDAINCIWYTYQSATNEKIPEEKRKFVAFMDFFNGLINVAVPWIIGDRIITKYTDKFIDWANKNYNKGHLKNAGKKLEELAKEDKNFKFLDEDIKEAVSKKIPKELNTKFIKAARIGLAAMTMLVVSQILVKRVLTPLIATPMAGAAQKYSDKQDAKKKAAKDNAGKQTTQTADNAEQSALKAFMANKNGSTNLLKQINVAA